MSATVLKRFKRGILSGRYDQTKHIDPLLTVAEQGYIKNQKKKEANVEEADRRQEAAQRKRKAANLLQRYVDREDICELICAYYGTNETVDLGIGALIFFSRENPNRLLELLHELSSGIQGRS